MRLENCTNLIGSEGMEVRYDGKIAILCILCVVSCMRIYLSNKQKKAKVVSL